MLIFCFEKNRDQTRPVRFTGKKECKFKRLLAFTKEIGEL